LEAEVLVAAPAVEVGEAAVALAVRQQVPQARPVQRREQQGRLPARSGMLRAMQPAA
jgi:hypothetical protein